MEQSLEASRHVAASAASACSPGSTETEFAGLCFLRLALEGGRVSGEAPPGSGSAKKRSMVACQHKKETHMKALRTLPPANVPQAALVRDRALARHSSMALPR